MSNPCTRMRCDLGSILQNGVEGVEAATEEASDAAALMVPR
jgi:hypothetical protein